LEELTAYCPRALLWQVSPSLSESIAGTKSTTNHRRIVGIEGSRDHNYGKGETYRREIEGKILYDNRGSRG
jgi:hypothetical protein